MKKKNEEYLASAGISLKQDEAFKTGADSLLLARFADIRSGDKVLDLGTGSGVLLLLLFGREKNAVYRGVEIDRAVAGLARENFIAAGMPADNICCGDFRDRTVFPENNYDLIVANPPFFPVGTGKVSVSERKAVARHEIHGTIADLVEAAALRLKNRGRFAVVYPVRRMAELFRHMEEKNIVPKRMQPVYGRKDKNADIFLLEGIKDGKPGLEMLSPLFPGEDFV